LDPKRGRRQTCMRSSIKKEKVTTGAQKQGTLGGATKGYIEKEREVKEKNEACTTQIAWESSRKQKI